jgi:ABC-type enterochelin transport system substrate-binding protein
MRTTIAIGLTLLLGACGGGGSSSTTTASTSEPASDSAASATALAGGVSGSTECAKNPDFVGIYAGGTIKTCSSAHFDSTHKTSGSVSYTTPAAPAAVLAWSEDQAAKAGLPKRMSAASMVSVGEADKRMMVVIALPDGAGSKVTVNWTNPD